MVTHAYAAEPDESRHARARPCSDFALWRMLPSGRGPAPCRVTNVGEEMRVKEIWDRIEADYIEESQYQIPNPELGPLERRVGLTYEDALFSEDINVKDTEYWFTEPEGANRVLRSEPEVSVPAFASVSRVVGTRAQHSTSSYGVRFPCGWCAQAGGTRSPSGYPRPRSCRTSGRRPSTSARVGYGSPQHR